jgi:hypothetical protein
MQTKKQKLSKTDNSIYTLSQSSESTKTRNLKKKLKKQKGIIDLTLKSDDEDIKQDIEKIKRINKKSNFNKDSPISTDELSGRKGPFNNNTKSKYDTIEIDKKCLKKLENKTTSSFLKKKRKNSDIIVINKPDKPLLNPQNTLINKRKKMTRSNFYEFMQNDSSLNHFVSYYAKEDAFLNLGQKKTKI